MQGSVGSIPGPRGVLALRVSIQRCPELQVIPYASGPLNSGRETDNMHFDMWCRDSPDISSQGMMGELPALQVVKHGKSIFIHEF